jgi:hypothetical protein
MKLMKPSLLAKLFAKTFFMAGALLAICAPQASATVTYYVGNCASSTYFNTISDALAAAPAPNVVEVCPGTYPEQLLITRHVTLEGIPTSNADQVFITVPSGGFASNVCSEGIGQPVQVCVSDATTVDITDITVDGSGATGPVGILYTGTSGTLNRIETRFQEGSGIGMGIALFGAANTVTIENSNLHNFDFIGIRVQDNSASGNEFTVSMEGNTLAPDPTAENGIWFLRGKSVTISGNNIDGPSTPPCASDSEGCSAIWVTTALTGSISNNKIFGVGPNGDGITVQLGVGTISVKSNIVFDINGEAIQLFATGVTVTSNTIMQSQYGIDLECNPGNNVTSNTMTAIHTIGLANVPSGGVPVNYYYDAPTLYSTCP